MYARLIEGTLYMSYEFGQLIEGTLFMKNGFLENGTLYPKPEQMKLGGFGMKNARNRGMLFASWTGQSIPESASAVIGDSKGITDAKVTATTFGAGVNKASGEYVFMYDGTNWMLNNAEVTLNTYGITLTGDPAKNDIVVVVYTAAGGGWEALGKDNDDLSKDLNPDTETSKNVLGEVTFTHSGYESEVSVDPYFIDPARKMYAHLLDIAMQELSDEASCTGYVAEAYFTAANKATQTMTGYCYVRRAWFVPQSVGGDTAGLAIPVNVNPVGAMTKKKISYDMATNEATITDWE